MILFWNKRVIYEGNSHEEFVELREVLNINEIKYCYKSYGSSSKGAKYVLFVHKKDYTKGKAILWARKK